MAHSYHMGMSLWNVLAKAVSNAAIFVELEGQVTSHASEIEIALVCNERLPSWLVKGLVHFGMPTPKQQRRTDDIEPIGIP